MACRHVVYVTNVRILRRACYRSNGTRKVRWPNPTSARYVAELSNWRAANHRPGPYGRIPDGRVEAYACPLCEGWHVGRPPIPEWHHTDKERRPDLLCEIGVRATAILWAENSWRIRSEAGDTETAREGRVRRLTAGRDRSRRAA